MLHNDMLGTSTNWYKLPAWCLILVFGAAAELNSDMHPPRCDISSCSIHTFFFCHWHTINAIVASLFSTICIPLYLTFATTALEEWCRFPLLRQYFLLACLPWNCCKLSKSCFGVWNLENTLCYSIFNILKGLLTSKLRSNAALAKVLYSS